MRSQEVLTVNLKPREESIQAHRLTIYLQHGEATGESGLIETHLEMHDYLSDTTRHLSPFPNVLHVMSASAF